MNPLVLDNKSVDIDKKITAKASSTDSTTGVIPNNINDNNQSNAASTAVTQERFVAQLQPLPTTLYQQPPLSSSIAGPQVTDSTNFGYSHWYYNYSNTYPPYNPYNYYPPSNYNSATTMHHYHGPQAFSSTATMQQYYHYPSSYVANNNIYNRRQPEATNVDALGDSTHQRQQSYDHSSTKPTSSLSKENQQKQDANSGAVASQQLNSLTPPMLLQEQHNNTCHNYDDSEKFSIIKIPPGCKPGDTITFSIPNGSNDTSALMNDNNNDGEKQQQNPSIILAVVIPPTIKTVEDVEDACSSPPPPEGSKRSNQYILVNTSINKRSRLTMESFKRNSRGRAASASSLFLPHSPTRKSPQVIARRPPLHRVASTKDGWKKNRSAFPQKSSNVGKKFQVSHIPENDYEKYKNQSKLDGGIANSSSCDNTLLYDLVYDPKNPPDALPSILQKSSPENSPYKDWTDQQRTRFHVLMVRTMKNISCVNKMLGNIGVGQCLDYYYGSYKRTKEYEWLKETCPKHFEEDVLCGICNKPRAVIACDTCTDAYHLECLAPPLLEIPQVDLFECNICIEEKQAASLPTGEEAEFQNDTEPGSESLDKSKSSSSEEDQLEICEQEISLSTASNSSSSRSSKSIFVSKRFEGEKIEALEDSPSDQSQISLKQKSARLRRKSNTSSEQNKSTTPQSQTKSIPSLSKSSESLEKKRNHSRINTPKGPHHPRNKNPSSGMADISNHGHHNSERLSVEEAKLGAPISISLKNSFAYYETLQVLSPATDQCSKKKSVESPSLWTISVGDTVAIQIENNGDKNDVSFPLGIAQVIAMWREVSKEEAYELRRYMQSRLSGNDEGEAFSEIIDKQKISIEIRWFYRLSELPDLGDMVTMSPTAKSDADEESEVEEVYESDHIDICELSCVSRSVEIKFGESASNRFSFRQPTGLSTTKFCCNNFYFVVRKKPSPPPKHLGDTQFHRALNFSRIMKQSPNLKGLILEWLRKRLADSSISS